jgi:hypothetical protein
MSHEDSSSQTANLRSSQKDTPFFSLSLYFPSSSSSCLALVLGPLPSFSSPSTLSSWSEPESSFFLFFDGTAAAGFFFSGRLSLSSSVKAEESEEAWASSSVVSPPDHLSAAWDVRLQEERGEVSSRRARWQGRPAQSRNGAEGKLTPSLSIRSRRVSCA